MNAPVPLLERLGPGAAVACDLKCPNWNCRHAPLIHGSAEVVNRYGVKDLVPRYCPRCHVHLGVAKFVDLDAPAEHEQGHR